jgi:uncharacterized membrane protein YphA (DoxX/SURF4 family)
LILGLLTPLAMLSLLCTMLVAISSHMMRGDPWVAAGGPSFELVLALVGPGRFSLDARLFDKLGHASSLGFPRTCVKRKNPSVHSVMYA